MAPIKFEENIREKLQERELQPSDGAWDKLESRLGTTTQQKKPAYFWMALAASFVGILLIGTWILTGGDTEENPLVQEDPIEDQQETLLIEEKQDEIIAPVEAMETEQLANSETPEATTSSEKLIQKNKVDRNTQIAENQASEKENTPKKVKESPMPKDRVEDIILQKEVVEKTTAIASEIQDEESFIQQKVDQVIEEVKKIQKENSSVSAAEIDALLAKAQRDIATKRILNSNQQKVDAQALLMDVEVELERSFRDRVFDALGEGFSKVRTAVAERNN